MQRTDREFQRPEQSFGQHRIDAAQRGQHRRLVRTPTDRSMLNDSRMLLVPGPWIALLAGTQPTENRRRFERNMLHQQRNQSGDDSDDTR
ncbi:MAG: hypothetical protein M3Y77_22060 [Actinomycetota bacterium]|nr:hypothetical protein [Actinomycetota bacterium]